MQELLYSFLLMLLTIVKLHYQLFVAIITYYLGYQVIKDKLHYQLFSTITTHYLGYQVIIQANWSLTKVTRHQLVNETYSG